MKSQPPLRLTAAAGESAPAGRCGADLERILEGYVLSGLDPFDRLQLAYGAGVYRRFNALSDAGHEIFAISRNKRSVMNDAD